MDIKICSVENKGEKTNSFSKTYNRQNKKKLLNRDTEKWINNSWKLGVKEKQFLVTTETDINRRCKAMQQEGCSYAQHTCPKRSFPAALAHAGCPQVSPTPNIASAMSPACGTYQDLYFICQLSHVPFKLPSRCIQALHLHPDACSTCCPCVHDHSNVVLCRELNGNLLERQQGCRPTHLWLNNCLHAACPTSRGLQPHTLRCTATPGGFLSTFLCRGSSSRTSLLLTDHWKLSSGLALLKEKGVSMLFSPTTKTGICRGRTLSPERSVTKEEYCHQRASELSCIPGFLAQSRMKSRPVTGAHYMPLAIE